MSVVLTGDRPTGRLHLGHYIGSLQSRLKLQHENTQFIIIADLQALTDYTDNPSFVQKNVFEVALDYLAVGIDPQQSTIFIQSLIPELSELTMYYMNLVTVSRLQRNPTVKAEMKQKGFGTIVPVGFFVYPISQVADITAFKADLVPVGEDQIPMIEQAAEVVQSFNRIYGEVLVRPKALVPEVARLPGIDGKNKMSKSLHNAIYLSDSSDEIRDKVMSMYTDPNHLRVEDPGVVEGNPVFDYLRAFDSDSEAILDLMGGYRKGGLGDVTVKRYLNEILQEFIRPIRERREQLARNTDYVSEVLQTGSDTARAVASQTLQEVKQVMGLVYF